MNISLLLLLVPVCCCKAFIPNRHERITANPAKSRSVLPGRYSSSFILCGWLDNFLPAPIETTDDSQRRRDFPEQYPATYDLNEMKLECDSRKEATIIRPLLKQTMLESRPLQMVYDAEVDGWDAASFHQKVDGKGAAVVLATYQDQSGGMKIVGGYNPKGWSSNGGARPSVAAFLFYQKDGSDETIQKLKKVGGGGLACASDDPNYGISFGPDGLVIPLQMSSSDEREKQGRQLFASSKLGPYFERGPEDLSSLFVNGGVQLQSLMIFTGVYSDGEDIPYCGAVMDMTSG